LSRLAYFTSFFSNLMLSCIFTSSF